MSKRKLTLSVSRDLLEEANTRWIDVLAKELKLEGLEPTAEHEIPVSRPSGLDAAKIVRELRKDRAEAVHHDAR